MRGAVLFAFVVLAISSAVAVAQSPAAPPVAPPAVPPAAAVPADKAMAGTWEFTNADRDKICTVTFKNEPGSPGMKIEFDRACAGHFPFLREVTGWSLAENDFLRFLDKSGKSVLEFSQVEAGIYEAPRPGEGILFIQNPGASGPAPRTAAQMTGEWTVMRSDNRAVCGLTLSNTAAGDDFVVRLKQPCEAAITRFGPATWQMDRSELVLKSPRGISWRFEEGDNPNTWRRVPETADPISLVRK